MKLIKALNISNLYDLLKDHILIDQFLVSASNFVFTIYLANTLSETEFNTFGAIFILFLLISSLQNSLFIAPLYSLEKGETSLQIFNEIKFIHILTLFLLILVLFLFHPIITSYLKVSIDKTVYIKLMFSLLSIEFYRRVFISMDNIKIIYHDIIFYVLIPCIYFFSDSDKLEYLASLYFGLTTILYIYVFIFSGPNLAFSHYNKIRLYEYWKFSRWLFLAAILQFIGGNYIAIFAAGIVGPGIYGVVRAFQNIQGVFNVVLQYADTKLAVKLPGMNRKDMLKWGYSSIKSLIIYSSIIFICLHFFGIERIIKFLYTDSFVDYSYIFNYVFLLYLLSLVNVLYRNLLKATRYTSPILIGGIVSGCGVMTALHMYRTSWEYDGYYIINAMSLFLTFFVYMFMLRAKRL